MPSEAPVIDEKLDPALEGLEPQLVWHYFNQLRQIPRDSHKEEAVMQWIEKWAAQNKFNVGRDKVGNRVVYVDATPGYEDRPAVICQSHVDMVCVKDPGHSHNFDTDPIQLERYGENGEFIKAKGTTLGTDNGGAVASFMAVATDPTAIHPRLELLFTVDEEDTFTGAKELDISAFDFRGQVMINLDTSEVDKLCIGSAGYNDVHGTLPILRDAAELMAHGKFYEMKLANLAGGHSGDDITKNRGNAILMMKDLIKLLPEGKRIGTFSGGQKANAIPSDAECVVYLPNGEKAEAENDEASWQSTLHAHIEAKRIEHDRPALTLAIRKLEEAERTITAMTIETHDKLIKVLDSIPNGPLTFSEKIPGLPATSSNIGTVNTTEDTFNAEVCVRGAVTEEMHAVATAMGKHFAEYGFTAEVDEPVPSWDENRDSDLVRLAAEAHEQVTGLAPILTAFHSCLECGVVATKFPTPIPAISAGPDNRDEHSTMERVNIKSLQVSYERLKYMLKRIAEGALGKKESPAT